MIEIILTFFNSRYILERHYDNESAPSTSSHRALALRFLRRCVAIPSAAIDMCVSIGFVAWVTASLQSLLLAGVSGGGVVQVASSSNGSSSVGLNGGKGGKGGDGVDGEYSERKSRIALKYVPSVPPHPSIHLSFLFFFILRFSPNRISFTIINQCIDPPHVRESQSRSFELIELIDEAILKGNVCRNASVRAQLAILGDKLLEILSRESPPLDGPILTSTAISHSLISQTTTGQVSIGDASHVTSLLHTLTLLGRFASYSPSPDRLLVILDCVWWKETLQLADDKGVDVGTRNALRKVILNVKKWQKRSRVILTFRTFWICWRWHAGAMRLIQGPLNLLLPSHLPSQARSVIIHCCFI